MLRDRSVTAIRVAIVGVILSAWEICGTRDRTIFFFIGTPSAIAKEWWQLLAYEHLTQHFAVTAGEAVLGLLLGTILGATAGLTLWYSEAIASVLRPFIVGIGALPIIAFAPL